jgi:hypothetical protein
MSLSRRKAAARCNWAAGFHDGHRAGWGAALDAAAAALAAGLGPGEVAYLAPPPPQRAPREDREDDDTPARPSA